MKKLTFSFAAVFLAILAIAIFRPMESTQSKAGTLAVHVMRLTSPALALPVYQALRAFDTAGNSSDANAETPSHYPEHGTYRGFANAADYPAGFRPYGTSSPFNMRVSAHPQYLPTSSEIVEHQFPTAGDSTIATRSNEAGKFDYNHPRFFATAADPVVRIDCTKYCHSPENGGVPLTMHIPAVARPAGGEDAHIGVIQPDGTEITMWAVNHVTTNWKDGGTISAANVANCGNFVTGRGTLGVGPGPTAMGACTDAGITTAAELVHGDIPHALFVSGNCAIGSQYPVQRDGSTSQCTSGIGPPLGGREWYDVPCATTTARTDIQPWQKAILCALNEYGGYMADNGNGGAYFVGGLTGQVESDEPWYDYNGANYKSPFAVLAAQGWFSGVINDVYPGVNGTRWYSPNGWNPGAAYWQKHIHWLAPCSARGSC